MRTHLLSRFANRISALSFATMLLGLFARPVHAADGPHRALDTTSPNLFWFTSETYYVDEDASNAEITVGFSPGDRSWSGSVDYTVSNGTAIGGEDFTAVSGTLHFSGPGTAIPKIIIPITMDNLCEGDETVQLLLSSPDAILTRSKALLVIIDRPRIKIIPAAGQAIVISWPSDYAGFVLEKNESMMGGSWSPVSSPPVISDGSCCVTQAASGGSAFYRLRRITSP